MSSLRDLNSAPNSNPLYDLLSSLVPPNPDHPFYSGHHADADGERTRQNNDEHQTHVPPNEVDNHSANPSAVNPEHEYVHVHDSKANDNYDQEEEDYFDYDGPPTPTSEAGDPPSPPPPNAREEKGPHDRRNRDHDNDRGHFQDHAHGPPPPYYGWGWGGPEFRNSYPGPQPFDYGDQQPESHDRSGSGPAEGPHRRGGRGRHGPGHGHGHGDGHWGRGGGPRRGPDGHHDHHHGPPPPPPPFNPWGAWGGGQPFFPFGGPPRPHRGPPRDHGFGSGPAGAWGAGVGRRGHGFGGQGCRGGRARGAWGQGWDPSRGGFGRFPGSGAGFDADALGPWLARLAGLFNAPNNNGAANRETTAADGTTRVGATTNEAGVENLPPWLRDIIASFNNLTTATGDGLGNAANTSGSRGGASAGNGPDFSPPVDIYRIPAPSTSSPFSSPAEAGGYEIHVSLPGLQHSDLTLTYHAPSPSATETTTTAAASAASHPTIRIAGVVYRPQTNTTSSGLEVHERDTQVGWFEREIRLPLAEQQEQEKQEASTLALDEDHIEAKLRDGILVVRVPIVAEKKGERDEKMMTEGQILPEEGGKVISVLGGEQ